MRSETRVGDPSQVRIQGVEQAVERPSIAIACDDAFSFSYSYLLDSWRRQGATLSTFSPLADEAPDATAGAVFLPGGYPELHAGRIAANLHFLDGLRSHAGLNATEAVGVSEAPRGTLFHHYRVDDDGLITRVNLIIATGQNNGAMNRTVTQIARHYLSGERLSEGLLNRVEAGIRCFDPCLSCSTHAAGQMPLQVQLFSSEGELLQQRRRD